VEEFFAAERPAYVFLAAAKVGGIGANSEFPADFMYDNMILEMNVIHAAWKNGCRKLEFLGSSCIYPRLAPQPMKEDCLLTSSLEETNEAYALAKISGLKYCAYLNRQYGTDYISVMPTNLYGPNDNYHPTRSHVLPALIRRFHEAKMAGGAQMFAFAKSTDIMRVGERNANAVRDLLKAEGIRLLAEDTGSNYGRTVQINLENGVYTVKTMVKGEKEI